MKTRFSSSFVAAAALAASLCAVAALTPDAVLVEDKGVKVTALDFEGYLLRLPEHVRGEARAAYDRVATMVDAIYVGRATAKLARDIGLDKDPAVQARLLQVQEGVLTELYLQHYDKQFKMPDLEQRARELYKANPKAYAGAEMVHIQHILVGLVGRTKDMAHERAKQLRAEVAASKDAFTVLAKKHSDDPDMRRNSGDLGFNAPTAFEPQINAAIAKMKPGELSEPIETRHGYHLVKFVERRAAKPLEFETVRADLIRQERDRILKERRDALLQEIRDSKTVIIHKANVEALVTPVDMSKASSKAAPK